LPFSGDRHENARLFESVSPGERVDILNEWWTSLLLDEPISKSRAFSMADRRLNGKGLHTVTSRSVKGDPSARLMASMDARVLSFTSIGTARMAFVLNWT